MRSIRRHRAAPAAMLALALLATVSACATTDQYGYSHEAGDKQVGGTVAGAALGALAGVALDRRSGAAIAAGAILGGLVGNRIGAQLDEKDRLALADAQYRGLEQGRSGESVGWRNPDSGNYGRITPRPAYDREGETCRSYESEVFIEGRRDVLTGLACRDADGRWRDARG